MRSIKNEKGYTMLIVIVFSAVALLLCASLFTMITSEININTRMERREITSYVALSGIEHAVNILYSESLPQAPTQTFKLFEEDDMIGEYKILELDKDHIVSNGKLIKDGIVIDEVTVNAQIDENGFISFSE